MLSKALPIPFIDILSLFFSNNLHNCDKKIECLGQSLKYLVCLFLDRNVFEVQFKYQC